MKIDYNLLNLRFNVSNGITKIIVNCEECKHSDHVFSLPDGNWNVEDIINNLERFAFGTSHDTKDWKS